MANKFYNGVSLPELPEIDRDTYPYLYIIDASISIKNLAGIEVEGYLLACCPDPVTINNNDPNILLEIPQNDTKAILYATIVSGEAPGFENFVGKWDVYGQETNYVLSYSHKSPLIWTNHDIVWPDGWVYMKASEPTTKILYSTGLHPEPPEWDKETYPYGAIVRARQWSVGDAFAEDNTLIVDTYVLVGTRSPLYAQWDEEDGLSGYIIVESDESSVDILQAIYAEYRAFPEFEPTNSWEDANVDDPFTGLPIGEIQNGTSIIRYELIWTNTDIPKETPDSETIFFKAEEVADRIYYGPFLTKVHPKQSSMNEDMRELGNFWYRTFIRGLYGQDLLVVDLLMYSSKPLVVVDGNLCVPPSTECLNSITGVSDDTLGVWGDFEQNHNATSSPSDVGSLDILYVIPEYDLLDEDGNIIRRASQPSVNTQAIVWNLSIPKAKEVTILDGQFIKIGDVITVDQLKQLGLAIELGGLVGMILHPGRFGAGVEDEDFAEIAPAIQASELLIIFPYDDYTMTVEGESVYFPEKGTYFLNALANGVNSGFVAFDIPKQIPLFEGEIVCYQNSGYMDIFEVNLPDNLAVGDILLVTFDGIEYTDVVQEYDGSLYFGSSVDFNSGMPTFDTRPYTVMTVILDEDVNLYVFATVAKDQGIHQIKIVRYMRGTGEPAPELLPREVTVEISKNPIPVGETAQVTITSDNASAENPTYTYHITNYMEVNGVAPVTVDENGLITVVAENKSGPATLVVESPATASYSTFRQEITINIESPGPGPDLEKAERNLSASVGASSLLIGDTTQITVSDNASSDSPTYSYASGNTTIATVSSSGIITAKAAGSVVITINAPETANFKAGSTNVTITVNEPEKADRNMSVSISNSDLTEGDTAQLTITDNASSDSPTYTYSVRGSSVKVSNKGVVTALAEGSSTITVSSTATKNYKSGSVDITVNVKAKPKLARELSASVVNDTVMAGNVTHILITDNASGDVPVYVFTSGDTKIATVDSNGVINALGEGTVTITITSAATSNYLNGETHVQITVVPLVVKPTPNDLTLDFTDANWRELYPNSYTVVDDAIPFYTASTFTYNGKDTLRSGQAGHSGVSRTTINFKLLQAGSIEFNYTVSSEGSYDHLFAILDGTEVVKVSGTVSWTTFSRNLDVGDHTLELKYTKDGSVSKGSDAGAIGYIRIVGMEPPFDKKYLVRCEDVIYNIVNGNIVALSVTELTAEVFKTYGSNVAPTWEQISSLTNPDVLLWYDSEGHKPLLDAYMTAIPPAQTVMSCKVDLLHPTIKGVDFVTTEFEGAPLYSCSFNDGELWFIHDGTEWVRITDLNTGMSAESLMAITTEQWTEKVAVAESIIFRFILNTVNDKVKNITVDYTN